MNTDYAVIFDMDGVLVDTYWPHYESWQVMARRQGLPLTEADFKATFGRTSREIIAHLWGQDGGLTDAKIAALDDEKEVAFREIIRADCPAMPGVHELLKGLHQSGFKLAVGSSGPPENIATVLDALDAKSLFSAVVTATDVTRGKPDPQVFQVAAEKLGVKPQRCVVVEDAPAGITAAQAAGMASVGLASTGRTAESLADADLVVETLDELSPDIFRTLVDRHAV